MKTIYLDHAAATPMHPEVVEAMRPYMTEFYGNPSSFHRVGLDAKRAVDEARKTIAELLHAHADEILFTSGGTESDNMAVLGIPRFYTKKLRELMGTDVIPHVITSQIEHHAVLEPLLALEKRGEIALTQLAPDSYGMIHPKQIKEALKPETVLVSIMTANNEIGTINPIADIGRVLLAWRKEQKTIYPFFHSDACQATGALDLNVEQSHVDLLTINGSKMYGPKGVGALFLRRGVRVDPLTIGGGQERGMRAGTEAVSQIVGLAKAFELAQASREEESKRLITLRDFLTEGLLKIPKTRLNGHPTERLPNSVNVSFLDIEGEACMLYLDAKGIMCSTGSACASTSLDPSHVILATGLSYEAAHGAMRFTLGASTTKEDIDYVLKELPPIIEMLRAISPSNVSEEFFKPQK